MSQINFRTAFTRAFHVHTSDLFKDLIWPAAAGNVAWALLQIVVSPAPHQRIMLRVLVLFLVAAYLAIDWSRSKSLDVKSISYWIADFLLVSGIVVFAIALASYRSEGFLECSLAFVFLVGTVSHLFGAWETSEKPSWWRRISLAGCGLVGLIALGIGRVIWREPALETLLAALAIVLAAWITTRVRIEAHAFSAPSATE